jgi:hypothetical protein
MSRKEKFLKYMDMWLAWAVLDESRGDLREMEFCLNRAALYQDKARSAEERGE